MQDFTKQNAMSNSPKIKQPRWLKKDRFWNFVFWFGMSFGFAITFSIPRELQDKYALSTVLIWLTLVGVPLLVRHFSKTTFVKEKMFLNSEGDLITEKQVPKSTFLALLAGVGLTFFIAEIFLPRGYSNFFLDLIFWLSLFSGISVYFIYKNCPISILFNRKAWELYLSNNTGCKTRVRHNSRFVTHPVYKHLPYNIFHKRR